MSTIVFAMADSISHHNASYKIANRLKKEGHTIVYIGDSRKREKEVVGQGFRFETIYHDFFESFNDAKEKGVLGKIKTLRNYIKHLKRYKQALMHGDEMAKLIERVKPDLFVVDVFHILHAILIYRHNVKTVLLQTYVATDKADNVPPLNSKHIPDHTFWSRVRIEVAWRTYFARRFLRNLWNRVVFLGLDRNSIFNSLVRTCNFPAHHINNKRVFHAGISSVPELVLCAKEFDFPRPSQTRQHFVGPMVEFNRNDVLYDERYLEVALERELQADPEKNRPLIYCSLGTININWYKHSSQFFQMLMEAFATRPEYDLFVAVGSEIPLNKFVNVPDNVHIFKYVPQIDILENASVMITHGGINSINECIFAGVPMIVYPLSANIDQHGNAARVAYRQLGLRGDINSENGTSIMAKIDRVLNDPSYKRNVEKMREVYRSYEKSTEVVDIIESYLVS
ncbi:nucleotide disphospho-sugar-binding domain-containing protein [Chryseolinea lacunae]|uniref:Glycosyltransferase family 1 protein n=1 Tax=Chryseolinea lacunae TaxID=2801331 RepID=A0ABS1KXN1_9BACT|nr:glycosyltransferase [Chryseolinea lacunae]MBL0743061.1 glycosyltransferase family 1 protein [Chryseolinea lacunae]